MTEEMDKLIEAFGIMLGEVSPHEISRVPRDVLVEVVSHPKASREVLVAVAKKLADPWAEGVDRTLGMGTDAEMLVKAILANPNKTQEVEKVLASSKTGAIRDMLLSNYENVSCETLHDMALRYARGEFWGYGYQKDERERVRRVLEEKRCPLPTVGERFKAWWER